MTAASRASARACVAVLLIGLVGCSTSGSTPSQATTSAPSAPSVPAASMPAETTASTSSPATAGSLHWERVVVSSEDWAVTGLAVGDGQVLALVSGERSSVWASADGRSWHEAYQFAADEYAADIASSVSGFVAVGVTGVDRSHTAQSVGTPVVPTVWTSADGNDWDGKSVELDAPVSFDHVAVGVDGTLLAIGTCIDAKPLESQRLCGCFLTDAGGWAPANTTQTEGGQLFEVTAGGPGFVAVGELRIVEQPGRGAVWTSADGRTWQQVPDGGAFPGATLTGVTAHDAGLVVVGTLPDVQERVALPMPAVWHSEDGQAWSAATIEGLPPATLNSGGGQFSAVTRLPDGTLVAVGLEGNIWTASEFDLLLAVSSDGSTWFRVSDVTSPLMRDEPVQDFGLKTVVAAGDGVIAGGADRGAVVWVGER